MIEALLIFASIVILGSLVVLIHDLIEWSLEPLTPSSTPTSSHVILRRTPPEREQAALENFETFARGGAWQSSVAAQKTRQLLDTGRNHR